MTSRLHSASPTSSSAQSITDATPARRPGIVANAGSSTPRENNSASWASLSQKLLRPFRPILEIAKRWTKRVQPSSATGGDSSTHSNSRPGSGKRLEKRLLQRDLSSAASPGSGKRLEKRPLQRDLPPAAPFPVDALEGILGGAAMALHEATQAPLAICGNSVLAAAALAAQAHADVEIDGRVSPTSEFFFTVGGSGERKSAIDNVALKEHRAHEKRLQDAFGASIREYKTRSDAFDKIRGEVLSKKRPLEERISAAVEIGDEPWTPLAPILLCEEPTFPGLVKNLTTGQPSQGLFSDEGGRFLGSYAMSSENAVATFAGLSKLWDGKPVDRIRAGDGATKLHGRRLSLHMMLQPGVVETLMANPLAQDQGFMSRCLVVIPESTIGTRFYREVDLAYSAPMTRYHASMKGLLERPPEVEDSNDPTLRSQLKPRRLAVSKAAKRIYIEFHDTMERAMAADLKDLRAFANKAPEHLLRLAGTLALVENPEAVEIRDSHAASARVLVSYYLGEAHRLNELSRQDPELTLAQRLLEWLQSLNRPVSLVEIYQCGPTQLRNARRARNTAHILYSHGHVEPVRGILYRGQTRSEGWRLVP